MMIAIFLLSLMVIVSVHEAGHYFLARFFKVGIHTFSIGLGKTIVSFFAKKKAHFSKSVFFRLGAMLSFRKSQCRIKSYIAHCAHGKR